MRIAELQERARQIHEHLHKGYPLTDKECLLAHTVKISEEVGELCNEVLHRKELQRVGKSEGEIGKELADVFITTAILGEACKVNLEEALARRIEELKERECQQ